MKEKGGSVMGWEGGMGEWGRIIGQKREFWEEKIAPVDLFLFSPQLQTQKEADPMESFPTPSCLHLLSNSVLKFSSPEASRSVTFHSRP